MTKSIPSPHSALRSAALSLLMLVALAYGASRGLHAEDRSPANPSDTPVTPGLSAAKPATGTAVDPTPFEPADHAFQRLDTDRRGYVTKEQVGSLDRFPFDQADTNHDGKLTPDEFNVAWLTYSINR